MPNVIGGLLLGFIWQFIFIKGFATVGEATGIPFFNLPWLGDRSDRLLGHCHGLCMAIVRLSDGHLHRVHYECVQRKSWAAEIDGANRFQVLKSIIVPLIMPAVTVCLFLAISWSFKMFDLNLSLTKGGPYRSTESLAMNVYNEAFLNNRYGLGTAKS